MTDGFLGRWSRRKQDLREGKPRAEPAAPQRAPAVGAVPATGTVPVSQPAFATPAGGAPAMEQVPTQPASAPPPTLQDVSALTHQSDFTPFMAHGVAPDVRNAAVKKLFADPHFNVMDRLDTYIDDYSQPDPLPAAILRQMTSAKVLNLFDDEATAAVPAGNTPTAGDDADTPLAQDMAQSGPDSPLPDPPVDALTPGAAADLPEDAHTDLRLQPDHAPQREGAGPGP